MSHELTNPNFDNFELTDVELESVAGGHGHHRNHPNEQHHRDRKVRGTGMPAGVLTTGTTTTGTTQISHQHIENQHIANQDYEMTPLH